MRHILVACVAFGVLVVCGSISFAGVTYSNQAEDSTQWDGFASDYSPFWIGQTTIVEHSETNQQALDEIFESSSGSVMSAGTFTTMAMCGIYNQAPPTRWTVHKIDSHASASVHTSAEFLIADKPYSDSSANSSSNDSYNVTDLAHYAEIIDYNNRLLANASAIATQNANLGDRAFHASGRVSSATMLQQGAQSSESMADGKSYFDASYHLEKDTPFSFTLDLGSLADVDLSFTAVNDLTGETLWDLSPNRSGELRHLEWSGILDAGQYSFALNASTDSLIDQDGFQKLGGEAIYDIDLKFKAESYQLPSFIVVQDFQPKKPSNLILQGALILFGKNTALLSESNPLNAQVPEPCMLSLILVGFLSFAGFRRSRLLG